MLTLIPPFTVTLVSIYLIIINWPRTGHSSELNSGKKPPIEHAQKVTLHRFLRQLTITEIQWNYSFFNMMSSYFVL